MNELKERIHDEKNGLDYVLVGDYYIPDIRIGEPESEKPMSENPTLEKPTQAKPQLGMWGRMHREYLRNEKPAVLAELTLSGKLHDYLADINEQATERCAFITEQLRQREGVTEELKERNQFSWVCAMYSIRHRAEEIVKLELIYC